MFYKPNARYIQVKLKNGKILCFLAQFQDSTLDPETNGAIDDAFDLLKQLPAELLAQPPRVLLDQ
jgi:hypothetical protein